MNERDEKLRDEKLVEAYTFAREERATADTLLWEVSAIIWGGQTLLLGFVLEAISGSYEALILVMVVSFVGIIMAFFSWRVTKKRSTVCNVMVHVISKVEKRLKMPIRPQALISRRYPRHSQTRWSNLLNIVFGIAWVIVIVAAAHKLGWLASAHSSVGRPFPWD